MLRRIALIRPAAVAAVGGLGVVIARHNAEHAPVVVFTAVAVVVVATVLRERGLAVAALGVGATAAFAAPAGLGPLLVATGVVIGARPSLVDRRLAHWPEIVDASVGLPAVAGLASVAAAQPSTRGAFIAGAAAVLVVGTWWRGPRHGHAPGPATIASYLGAAGGVAIALAPARLTFLGELPTAVDTAGRGLAAAVAVFAVVCLIEVVRSRRSVAASR